MARACDLNPPGPHAGPGAHEEADPEEGAHAGPEELDPVDGAALKIAMRCWYPDELEELVTRHGFDVTGRWGGYEGEAWGEGGELVTEFRRA